jgi:hypothetical protein
MGCDATQWTVALMVPRTSGPSKLTHELPDAVPGPLKYPDPARVPLLMTTGRPDGKVAELEQPAVGDGPSLALNVIFTPWGRPAAVRPGLRVPLPDWTGQLAVPEATGAAQATPDPTSVSTPSTTVAVAAFIKGFRTIVISSRRHGRQMTLRRPGSVTDVLCMTPASGVRPSMFPTGGPVCVPDDTGSVSVTSL